MHFLAPADWTVRLSDRTEARATRHPTPPQAGTATIWLSLPRDYATTAHPKTIVEGHRGPRALPITEVDGWWCFESRGTSHTAVCSGNPQAGGSVLVVSMAGPGTLLGDVALDDLRRMGREAVGFGDSGPIDGWALACAAGP